MSTPYLQDSILKTVEEMNTPYLKDSILKAVEDMCPRPYELVIELEDMYDKDELSRQLRIFMADGTLGLDNDMRLFIADENKENTDEVPEDR
jgi:hypothetical protein